MEKTEKEYLIKYRMNLFEKYLKNLITLEEYFKKMNEYIIDVKQ